jgi:pimeloyl-ACP methyl ester carboxylesterase
MSPDAESRIRRHTVDANGLSFECLRVGDGDRLALCLHGFPDDAPSMVPVMLNLADAGYTAVAPYMRGYGPTDAAPDDDYSARALGQDAISLKIALSERFDVDDAYLVGHDWGAAAAYAADRTDPDAFERMATMAVPPGFDALLLEHPRQLLRSWYMWFFQVPDVPERALRWRDFALIEFLWGTWSPNWEYPDTRIDEVKDTFRAEGTVEAALQYYRDIVGSSLSSFVRGDRPSVDDVPPIRTPTLVLAGEADGCIGPALFDHADEIIEECRVVRVRDTGHFMQQEKPDVVSDEIIGFFE